MAIRKRKHHDIETPRVVEQESTTRGFNIEKSKTWKEQSIEILNILEAEQKINIYDSNNYGGMYLDTKQNASAKLKSLFMQNPVTVNNTKDKRENNIETPSSEDFKKFFQ